MNICLISQEYPPETNWGGIATHTRILANWLTEMGHRVHVISAATTGIETEVNDGLVVVQPDALSKGIIEVVSRGDLDTMGKEVKRRAFEFHSNKIVHRIAEYYARTRYQVKRDKKAS